MVIYNTTHKQNKHQKENNNSDHGLEPDLVSTVMSYLAYLHALYCLNRCYCHNKVSGFYR